MEWFIAENATKLSILFVSILKMGNIYGYALTVEWKSITQNLNRRKKNEKV
jgi:hypothetical protein